MEVDVKIIFATGLKAKTIRGRHFAAPLFTSSILVRCSKVKNEFQVVNVLISDYVILLCLRRTNFLSLSLTAVWDQGYIKCLIIWTTYEQFTSDGRSISRFWRTSLCLYIYTIFQITMQLYHELFSLFFQYICWLRAGESRSTAKSYSPRVVNSRHYSQSQRNSVIFKWIAPIHRFEYVDFMTLKNNQCTVGALDMNIGKNFPTETRHRSNLPVFNALVRV